MNQPPERRLIHETRYIVASKTILAMSDRFSFLLFLTPMYYYLF